MKFRARGFEFQVRTTSSRTRLSAYDGLCQLVHHFINRVFIEVTVGRACSPVSGGRSQHVALEAGVRFGYCRALLAV